MPTNNLEYSTDYKSARIQIMYERMFKARIQIMDSFFERANELTTLGMTPQQVTAVLFEEIANNPKSPLITLQNKEAREIHAMLKAYSQMLIYGNLEKETLYMWVYEPGLNHCKDCLARNRQVKTYEEWVALGLPGCGSTACHDNCYCDLVKVTNYNKQSNQIPTPITPAPITATQKITKPVKTKTLKPIKPLSEATLSWAEKIEQQFPTIKINLMGLDKSLAETFYNSLKDIEKEFGADAISGLSGIKNLKLFVSDLGRKPSGSTTKTLALFTKSNNGIYFNEKYYGDLNGEAHKVLIEENEARKAIGGKSYNIGNGTAEAVLYHEIGHLYYYKVSKVVSFSRSEKEVSNTISGYVEHSKGLTKVKEASAELFAKYMLERNEMTTDQIELFNKIFKENNNSNSNRFLMKPKTEKAKEDLIKSQINRRI